MAGDYTRFTFDPRRHFSKVLMQQGRVQLDADWNELVELLDRRRRAETADLVGRTGVPFETPEGFKIAIAGGSITIGRGRMYVDGLLAENHGLGALEQDEVLNELRGREPVPYERQPYFPTAAADAPISGDGPHLVFLDVWERELTALEVPELVEPAVGMDTATRQQTVWQVRVLSNVGAAVTCSTPDAEIAEWVKTIRPSAGRLTTADVAVAESGDPCDLSPVGGYRGAENRLYRVEVHRGGALGTASFKWSRDNGAVATAVSSVDGPRLTVVAVGRDRTLRFEPGAVVEVTDDRHELAGQPGVLRRVETVDQAEGTITLASALPAGEFDPADLARHTRVRRWDHTIGPLDGALRIPADGSPIVLEDGVQVTFGADPTGGELRAGDYWSFAARTSVGRVERLTSAPPRGIRHHYCRLAVVRMPETVADCRPVFRPLTNLDRAAGSCTIVVRPHESLQEAIDALPADGGRVCLTAGLYAVDRPVAIAQRRRVVIAGAGPATIVRALATEAALAFSACDEVEVRSLRVEGGIAAQSESLNGAVTFVGCTNAVVADCTLACPDSPAPGQRSQACLTFRSQTTGEGDHVRVEDCRFEVGAWQTGALVIDPGRATVEGNRLGMPGDPGTNRAAGQGIVVAGTRVGSVQILDNLVEDAAQGIHVGVSNGEVPGRELAGDVLLSRNVVHALVPAAHDRQRHAVFVGNARSIHLKDTIATLRRIGTPPQSGPTPVEGISIHGVLGPFVCVRQTSLRGFAPTGVSLVALGTPPADRMWLVAETMAEGAALGVSAPATVEQERNRPLPPAPPAGLTLAPATALPRVGVQHCLTATVVDASGRRVPSVLVRFAVAGANTRTGSVVTNASGEAQFCYVGTSPGNDTVTAFADTNNNGTREASEPQATAAVTYQPAAPGGPTSLTLGPASAAKTTGSQHCVVASARNAEGAPTANVVVRFTVTGANATTGAATTNVLGQAQFCYTGAADGTDRITAFADTNANGTRDATEPQAGPVTATFERPQLVTVPSVLGQTLAVATTRITSAGLVRGGLSRLPTPPRPEQEPGGPVVIWILGPEQVVEQTPPAGARAGAGSNVSLVLQRDWRPKGSIGRLPPTRREV